MFMHQGTQFLSSLDHIFSTFIILSSKWNSHCTVEFTFQYAWLSWEVLQMHKIVLTASFNHAHHIIQTLIKTEQIVSTLHVYTLYKCTKLYDNRWINCIIETKCRRSLWVWRVWSYSQWWRRISCLKSIPQWGRLRCLLSGKQNDNFVIGYATRPTRENSWLHTNPMRWFWDGTPSGLCAVNAPLLSVEVTRKASSICSLPTN